MMTPTTSTARHAQRCLLLLLLIASCATVVAAQEPLTANTLQLVDGGQPPPASIEELQWLAGHWQGEGLGGIAEEVWSPPLGGTMLGMFRLVRSDQIAFYEILTLRPEDGSVVLALKHFNPDLTGWEEKDEVVRFPLVRLAEGAAYFSGMTFRQLGEQRLQVFVVVGSQGSTPREAEFRYHRVGSAAHAAWLQEQSRQPE